MTGHAQLSLRPATSADEVFPFPFYQVRTGKPADFLSAYALYLHCDFSEKTWRSLAPSVRSIVILRVLGSKKRK